MNKFVAFSFVLFASIASQVQADVYLGGKLGASWGDDAGDNGPCSNCNDGSVAGGIYVGYNFTDMLSLELGYDNLGEFESNLEDSTVIDEDSLVAITLAPKLTASFGDFSLYGKLGGAKVDYLSYDDVTLLAALGSEYNITNRLAVRMEYQRINDISDGAIDGFDVNSVFLGLTYRFGGAPSVNVSPEQATADVVATDNEVATEPAEEAAVDEQPTVEAVQEDMLKEPQPVPQTRIIQEYGQALFNVASAELTENSAKNFQKLVEVMRMHAQAQAEIIGYTDSTGSAENNQELSLRRAQAVANYLSAQGVNTSRISVRGEGEKQPKASNDTAKGRIQNRRVEVIIDEFEVTEQ